MLPLLDLGDLFELKKFNFDLESVEDFFIEVYSSQHFQDENRAEKILDDLSATIEKRMPKLKRFKLDFEVSGLLFSEFQFDCPLLKTLFNGTESLLPKTRGSFSFFQHMNTRDKRDRHLIE